MTTPTTAAALDPTRLSSDQWERAWWLAPALAALQEVRTEMAQGFTELRTAVQALSGEGAETRNIGEAAIAMLTTLNERVQALQSSANTLTAQFTAAGQEASVQAQTVQAVTDDLNAEQQRIAEALAALQPAAPAPEPTPAEPAPAEPVPPSA